MLRPSGRSPRVNIFSPMLVIKSCKTGYCKMTRDERMGEWWERFLYKKRAEPKQFKPLSVLFFHFWLANFKVEIKKSIDKIQQS